MARDFTVADVLGIIAIIVAIIGLIFEPLILGVVAIVLALIGLYLVRDADRKNIFCIIGLILGIICVIYGIILLIMRLTHVPPGQAKK